MRSTHAFSLLVFAASLLVYIVMAMPMLAGPDMPWHLAAGQYMLEHWDIPHSNLWSFTYPDQPWYLLSWGWNIILGLLHSLAGVKAVFLFSMLLMAGVTAVLVHAVQQRSKAGSEALLLTTLLAILALLEFAGGRPQLAGYMFVLYFMFVLHRSRERQGRWLLYILPLKMLAWVNIHGSFLAGFVLIAGYALEALLTRRGPWFTDLCIVGLLCFLMIPINPYGIGIYDGIMGTLASSGLATVTEWRHFTFGESIGVSVWALVFVLALFYRSRSAPLADVLLSLFWLFAMLWSIRNAAIFVLVSAPYMAMNLQSVFDRLAHIRTKRPDPLAFLHKPLMAHKMLVLAVAVVLASSFGLDTIKGQRWKVALDDDLGKAIAYLQSNLPGARILNDYDYGGRIIYDTNGSYPVFIDSRLGTAYPDRLVADYVTFLLQEEGWEQVPQRYDIDGIFISNESKFAKAYAEGEYHDSWQEVYRNELTSIYVRIDILSP